MDEDVRLILSPHAEIRESGAGLAISCPGVTAEIGLAGGSPLRKAIAALDGSAAAGELLASAGAEAPSLRPVLHDLTACGILWDASDLLNGDDAARQLDCYYRLCDAWALDIFTGVFWTRMLAGEASPELVLGWCEQFYHRTVGADQHNASAVACCGDEWIRSALSDHFDEEFGHGEIFLAGLEACGLSRERIASRAPLASTRELIGFMDHLGRTNTLAYLGCYGVLHSPRSGQTLEAARAQFNRLAGLYPFAAPAMQAILHHTELDFAGQHDRILLEKLVRERGPLGRGAALDVLRAAHGTVRCFNRFFAGILDVYGP